MAVIGPARFQTGGTPSEQEGGQTYLPEQIKHKLADLIPSLVQLLDEQNIFLPRWLEESLKMELQIQNCGKLSWFGVSLLF